MSEIKNGGLDEYCKL